MGPRVTVVWSIGSRLFRGGQGGICGVSEPFPRHYFSRSHKVLSGYLAGCLEVDEHCLNITAAMHKDDKRCPEKKLYGKGGVKQAWSFMMPGFRHRNRPTKMHDKGERLKLRQRSLLRHPQSHHSGGHRDVLCILHFWVPSPSFPEGGANLGAGAVTSSRPWPSTVSSPEAAPDPSATATSSRGGGIPAATPAASAAPHWGGIPPMPSSGAAAAGASWISSRGENVLPALSSARAPAASAAPRGGGIPPMSSSWAAATSAAAATSFRGGGIPAAVPAAEVKGGTHVSGSRVGPPAVVGASPTPPASDPSVGAGAATGELLATEAINVIVRFNGRFLLDILVLTQAPIFV